jgi:hypothetical protein
MAGVSTHQVFVTMRAKCLEKGIKCGLADSFAMATVQIYKRLRNRGCAEAFDLVTSDKRVAHYVETAKAL